MIKLIECPRDAMQGIKEFIPTECKVEYINQLLQVGFDTLDFGSFVSPKAIPQMRDTAEVLKHLDLSNTNTKLLAIVANQRGALDAVQFEQISYLGYPFSISETFQIRNTNATIEESLERVAEIQELCMAHQKTLVVYVSMGFGNPYGDDWNVDIVQKWVNRLVAMGITILQLSDTIGVSTPDNIQYLFSNLLPHYQGIEIGAHLHTEPHNWREKVMAAYQSGCYRFDGAIKGFGGCPMAKDDLTGNMPTEHLIAYFQELHLPLGIDENAFEQSLKLALQVFPIH
ncbi:MAG: hydroxymethylglutaryl-CoA lyase [Saprospiraceae bacterium]|nr:hydroxymethylglutaryl-CoA lyase [Saprospiraceae bacterium]